MYFGMATICSLPFNTGLFCKGALHTSESGFLFFETCILKEATKCWHPIWAIVPCDTAFRHHRVMWILKSLHVNSWIITYEFLNKYIWILKSLHMNPSIVFCHVWVTVRWVTSQLTSVLFGTVTPFPPSYEWVMSHTDESCASRFHRVRVCVFVCLCVCIYTYICVRCVRERECVCVWVHEYIYM